MSIQTTYGAAPAVAFEGMLVDDDENVIIAMRNNEASAEIAFGRAVAFEGSTDDMGALLPSSENSLIAGIVLHSHAYSKSPGGDLGTTGIKPGGMMNVLVKGSVWAIARSAVAAYASRLWVRGVSAESGYEILGGLEDADDSTDTVDCTKQGRWETTAAQGDLARLRVDFTQKP